MRNITLIISLNFHPGHVSHLVASYKQCEEIGYESVFYVTPQFRLFLPADCNIVMSDNPVPKCEVAVLLFPSLHNLPLIYQLRKSHTKIVYVFHEPLAPLKHYRESGFSYKYLAKLWVIDHVSALTVRWSDIILLPSHKAEEYYWSNMRYKNSNAHYIPLMYDDEAFDYANVERKYISYIGTIAADHSFDEFIRFVEAALKKDWFKDKHFLIATKSDFEVPELIQKSNRVKIVKGHPLTDDEINEAYASSSVIWNAYIRTTQSGVLAKAYMFGTPAIVMRHNLNEFMQDGKTVECVEDNRDSQQIKDAVEKILNRQHYFTTNCRKTFLNTFYYRIFNNKFKSIIDES